MTEQELKTNKAALELLQSEAHDNLTDYKAQISLLDQQLKDLGKISLPPVVFDDIHEAVERGVGEFDFSDQDNYSKEFNLDYDNRVELDSLELDNTQDLVEMIVEQIHKLFVEAECPEDELDTTEPDNHRGEIGG